MKKERKMNQLVMQSNIYNNCHVGCVCKRKETNPLELTTEKEKQKNKESKERGETQ